MATILLAVPFAAIADASRRGDVEPRVIYGAIASYLLAFSNYPLSLLQDYHWIGGASFRIASEYGFAAAILAYLLQGADMARTRRAGRPS